MIRLLVLRRQLRRQCLSHYHHLRGREGSRSICSAIRAQTQRKRMQQISHQASQGVLLRRRAEWHPYHYLSHQGQLGEVLQLETGAQSSPMLCRTTRRRKFPSHTYLKLHLLRLLALPNVSPPFHSHLKHSAKLFCSRPRLLPMDRRPPRRQVHHSHNKGRICRQACRLIRQGGNQRKVEHSAQSEADE